MEQTSHIFLAYCSTHTPTHTHLEGREAASIIIPRPWSCLCGPGVDGVSAWRWRVDTKTEWSSGKMEYGLEDGWEQVWCCVILCMCVCSHSLSSLQLGLLTALSLTLTSAKIHKQTHTEKHTAVFGLGPETNTLQTFPSNDAAWNISALKCLTTTSTYIIQRNQ